MKKDLKYIIKRILIGVGIVLVMSFISSCQVHAETYNLDSSQVTSYYRVNNSTLYDLNYNNWYNIGSNNTLTNLRLGLTPYNPNTCTQYGACSEGLQPGQYLFDFYLLTDGGVNVNNCNQLSSDFQNVNMTTGNWVNNQIKSSCVDVSTYVESGYATYLHILYSFTSSAFATEYRFYFNYGSGWLNGSNQFKVLLGNVYDFDQTIINDFKQQKLNEQQINQNNTIINQNTQIINGQQSIINSQNQNAQQAHQDSQAINDSINDSSIPSDSSSKINNITDTIKANQNSSIVQIATFFPQTLQLILNGFNTSCTGGYSLGSLYGTELTIPCINPVDYLGSFLWGVIDSILCLCYLIPLCKFLVNKYNDLTSMKNLRWQ